MSYVFILCREGAEALFSGDSSRTAQYEGSNNGWWLRFYEGDLADMVYGVGGVGWGDLDVNTDGVGVRPAMWVAL